MCSHCDLWYQLGVCGHRVCHRRKQCNTAATPAVAAAAIAAAEAAGGLLLGHTLTPTPVVVPAALGASNSNLDTLQGILSVQGSLSLQDSRARKYRGRRCTRRERQHLRDGQRDPLLPHWDIYLLRPLHSGCAPCFKHSPLPPLAGCRASSAIGLSGVIVINRSAPSLLCIIRIGQWS